MGLVASLGLRRHDSYRPGCAATRWSPKTPPCPGPDSCARRWRCPPSQTIARTHTQMKHDPTMYIAYPLSHSSFFPLSSLEYHRQSHVRVLRDMQETMSSRKSKAQNILLNSSRANRVLSLLMTMDTTRAMPGRIPSTMDTMGTTRASTPSLLLPSMARFLGTHMHDCRMCKGSKRSASHTLVKK